MHFNGVDLSEYLTVNEISGRGVSPSELTTIEVPYMDGAYLASKKRPPRYIDVRFTIHSENAEELRKKIDDLNTIFDVDEPVPIVFDDEPEITYYGVPEDTNENSEFVRFHQGMITFYCPDPYKYGQEKYAVFPSDHVKVTNKGSAEARPIFEIEALEPVTYAMIQKHTGEYMMMGRPLDVEVNKPFVKYERIFFSDANNLTGWTTAAPGEIDGNIAGTMETSNDRFQAASYGTGSSWHGPAIKTSLSEVLTDFRMTAFISLYNRSVPSQVGRVEIYLLDANGQQVCKVAMKDTSASQALAWGEARAGTNSDGHFLINEYGDKPGNWNNFSGHVRIEREGNLWRAYFAKVDTSTGRHHTRRSVTWIDTQNKYSRTVSQVVVHIGAYGTYAPIGSLGVYSINVFKINNPSQDEVPYIAEEGDVITFDHEINELFINGEPRKDLKDFGAEYFKLDQGENELIVFPENSFATSVRYKERFK